MMDLRAGKMVTVLFVSTLSLSILTVSMLTVSATEQTVIWISPQEIVLGNPVLEDIVNTTFTIAVVVENVTNLYGLNIQFGWNITYLEYVNHTLTIPVENYSEPIPPSPYPGILHEPFMKIKDEVYVNEGWYWIACSSRPWLPFNGNGTVFIMTFRVKYQPLINELPAGVDHVNLTLRFVSTDLADSAEMPIPHTTIDGNVKLYAQKRSADINRDGIVDIYDIVTASDAYGSCAGDPNWNPLADLAPQWGRIDIYDLVTCAYHYGETYP